MMKLNDILLKDKEPLKLVCLTLTNKELEQVFCSMILEETGIDLVIQLKAEWGSSLIMVVVPAWEDKKLSVKEFEILNDHGYSFDFPDEDLDYLLERLFMTEDTIAIIEAKRGEMKNEEKFEIDIFIQLDFYEKLLADLS